MPRISFDPEQTLTYLEQAERHVSEGGERLRRLRMLVAQLEKDGHPTEQARTLLDQFERTHKAQIDARDTLRREAAETAKPTSP
jgi:hypothetical protein